MPAQRFDQRVQLTKQNLSSGAAQGLESMAGEFRKFSEQKMQEYKQSKAEESLVAGQQAFVKGQDPQFADENVLLGKDNAVAYNKGLRHSYMASLSNDIRGGLAKIELENQADTIGYTKAAKAFTSGMLSEVDPTVALQVEQSLAEQITLGNTRVAKAEYTAQRAEQRAVSEQNVDALTSAAYTAARDLDMDGVVQAGAELDAFLQDGLDAGLYAPSEVADIKLKAERTATMYGELGGLDKVIADAPRSEVFEQAKAYIDSVDQRLPNISEVEKSVLQKQLDDELTEVMREQRAELQERSAAQVLYANNLIVAAKQPNADRSTLIAEAGVGYEEGKLTQGEYVQVIKAAQRGGQEADDLDAEVGKVIRRQTFDGVVVSQKGVDEFYRRNMAKQVESAGNPLVANAEVAEFVHTTRMIPTQYKDEIVNLMNSGDNAQVSVAVDFIDRIDNIKGVNAFEMFTPEQRAFAGATLALSKNLPHEKAVELARQQTDMGNAAMVEARDNTIKEWNSVRQGNKDYKDYGKMARGIGDFNAGSINETAMAKEIKDTMESLYRLGAPEDYAEETAIKLVENNWRKDVITGRVNKYPASDYIQDYELAQSDLLESVNTAISKGAFTSVFAGDDLGFTPTVEDVRLYADEQTAREASFGMPTYRAYIVNPETQEIIPLGIAEETFRWSPPYAEAKAKELDPQELIEMLRGNSRAAAKRAVKGIPDFRGAL